MLFVNPEKKTQTENFVPVHPDHERSTKDGYNGPTIKLLENNPNKGKMSISSVETICSYANSSPQLGREERACTANSSERSEESQEFQIKGTNETNRASIIHNPENSLHTESITHTESVTNRNGIENNKGQSNRGCPSSPTEILQKASSSCALGRINSNYIIHSNNNTSGIRGEWSGKVIVSNVVNNSSKKESKLMSICGNHSTSDGYSVNEFDKRKKVEQQAEQVDTAQVRSSETGRRESCEYGVEDYEEMHRESIKGELQIACIDNNNKHNNFFKEIPISEHGSNSCCDYNLDNNKKVIINTIKNVCQTNGDTFTYLNEMLNQTYKENVELDGSEYIFLYDICLKDVTPSDEVSKVNEGNRYYENNSIGAARQKDEKDLLILNGTYNKYLNIFHNVSSQISKVKRLLYPREIHVLRDYTAKDPPEMMAEVANKFDNTQMECDMQTEMNHWNEKLNRCTTVSNQDETNLESVHALFTEENQVSSSRKMKLLEKLNYIFFAAMRENFPDYATCVKVDGRTTFTGSATHNDIGDTSLSVLDAPANAGENIITKAIATTAITATATSTKNSTTRTSDYSKSSKRNTENDQLRHVDMGKISYHMKNGINRRVHETDIYDIQIIKKGYTFIFIKREQWKKYYCIFFNIKSNTVYKNNLIYKHYCKVYDKELVHNLIKAPDSYSNYFLAFFQDDYFEMSKISNLQIAILLRKNSYEFIFEISKNEKSNIVMHNFQDIHLDHVNIQRVRSSLNVFDINSAPYYFIPFQYSLDDFIGSRKEIINSNSFQDTTSLNRGINLQYNLLKEWNDCLCSVMEKMKYRCKYLSAKRGQNEKTHYVNKKFHQWIEAFKQERNIQDRTRVC
ncbi:hypothetical protein, conserved [Plasmodium gonderi]|uniref:Uncharacterized protein n=1 Tax=Plasmodium gonderi TaxID=77519 RepID=A0A1Y1JL05_PLAGO|nr:hypothetical protein, conserved [Plasmodium gonderi]GAW81887.1 hypothetical protein, conserved [Plasmodium gonderi]